MEHNPLISKDNGLEITYSDLKKRKTVKNISPCISNSLQQMGMVSTLLNVIIRMVISEILSGLHRLK